MNNENKNYRTGEVTQLRRIADTLEEILRLVKKDQELVPGPLTVTSLDQKV